MESSWRDIAACVGADPEIFYWHEAGDKSVQGMTTAQMKDMDNANFLEAKAYCDACPVVEQCEKESFGMDEDYTFRAGKPPRKFKPRKRGRPTLLPSIPCPPVPDDAPEFCSRGHKARWIMRPKQKRADGGHRWGRECSDCRNESARQRLARKAEGKPVKPTLRTRHPIEHPDHEPEWVKYSDGERCRLCYNEKQRRYKAKSRAERGIALKRPSREAHEKTSDEGHRDFYGHFPIWKTPASGKRYCGLCQYLRRGREKNRKTKETVVE